MLDDVNPEAGVIGDQSVWGSVFGVMREGYLPASFSRAAGVLRKRRGLRWGKVSVALQMRCCSKDILFRTASGDRIRVPPPDGFSEQGSEQSRLRSRDDKMVDRDLHPAKSPSSASRALSILLSGIG
jgi:hypothetical protein